MSLKDELEARMLVLESDNQQDSEEYKQLEAIVLGRAPKPRYPVTEHLVTVYCTTMTLDAVIARVEKLGYPILEVRKNNAACWFFVKGIPNILAGLDGVIIIGWRTAEENERLNASLEARNVAKDK